MKKIWLITKVQLRATLDLNINKKIKHKSNSFVIFSIVTGLLLMVTSFAYFYGIGMTLNMFGMIDVLPELVMAIISMVTLMTSVYKVKGILFGFKDYDLLMALPIKTSSIVISRFLILYIVNLIVTFIILIPSMVVYGALGNPTLWFYITNIIALIMIPLVPMVIAYIIGLLIALITQRFMSSNIINVIFSVVTISIIMILSFGMNDTKQINDFSTSITEGIDKTYFLARWYNLGFVEGKVEYLLLFTLSSLLIFGIFALVVGKKFKSINTYMNSNHTKSNYKMESLKQGSPLLALYKKEMKRFFSSSLYMMNTAVGIVMLTLGAIATVVLKPDQLVQLLDIPGAADQLGAIFPLGISLFIAMTYITACSISLEGSHLWVLKSLPISTRTIFLSKILVSLTITMPAIVINGILIMIALRLNFIEGLLLIILPSAYAIFTAILGLIINLMFPKLSWSTETTVIKQSAASMIAMLASFLVVGLPFVVLTISGMKNSFYVNGGTAVVVLLLSFVCYQYLLKGGSKRFSKL